MSPQKAQDYRSHRRFAPGYHFVTLPLVLTYLIWSIRRVTANPMEDTWYALVGALALTGVYLFSRVFPLKVQDRVIRLEERLRLVRVLPADLQPHVESIRASHLIAMRFASDDELPALVRQVIANPSMSSGDIKKQVKHWRPDWFRV